MRCCSIYSRIHQTKQQREFKSIGISHYNSHPITKSALCVLLFVFIFFLLFHFNIIISIYYFAFACLSSVTAQINVHVIGQLQK